MYKPGQLHANHRARHTPDRDHRFPRLEFHRRERASQLPFFRLWTRPVKRAHGLSPSCNPKKLPHQGKVDENRQSMSKRINRGRNSVAFLSSISGLHQARAALIRAKSSANECLPELNVVVFLHPATKYARYWRLPHWQQANCYKLYDPREYCAP